MCFGLFFYVCFPLVFVSFFVFCFNCNWLHFLLDFFCLFWFVCYFFCFFGWCF
jgi:hypothetical protein